MTAVAHQIVTFDQYEAEERARSVRHEFVRGRVVTMTGSIFVHGLIVTNIARALAVRAKDCTVVHSIVRLRVGSEFAYYPDVALICGQVSFTSPAKDCYTNPTILVEVLSPSTELRDRGEKFRAYQRLDSLMYYVMVSSTTMEVEVFTSHANAWSEYSLRSIRGFDYALATAEDTLLFAVRGGTHAIEIPVRELYEHAEEYLEPVL